MDTNKKRNKLLAVNTTSSFVLQLTTIICGFILPRLILISFGSNVNGLVNSITQFLHIIAFLELGVGAVVQSCLYKPLAEHDELLTSQIIVSANKFFRSIAYILLIYIVVLVPLYPLLVKKEFGFIYTTALLLAISISYFAQYYFGVVDRLLLTADQRGYVQYNAQTITLIINTIACYVLIKLGASIQLVKLTTSIIYLARPLYLRLYVNKHYSIDRKVSYEKEPIKQKWNGIAQHVAAVVLDGTDSIVLTVFGSLAEVSIYSVYNLVLMGVKQLTRSLTGGVQALLGELWVKEESEELHRRFGNTEWTLHTATTIIFGCTGVLIVPFITVYTNGVNDANYYQPLFAILITLANAFYCIRLPYNIMILAAGHYKETQSNYIIAMLLNIIVSIATVIKFGLIGVAIGTLIAMVYQTIWMAIYDSKNLLKWPFKNFLKQCLVDMIVVGAGVFATHWLSLLNVSYSAWILLAIEVLTVWLAISILVNLVFFNNRVKRFAKRFAAKQRS